MTSGNTHIQIADDILTQEVNGEMVLLNLHTECYFGLDTIGTRIWQLINEYGDSERIFTVMKQEYDVDPAQLQQDIDNLMEKLRQAGLVTTSTV